MTYRTFIAFIASATLIGCQISSQAWGYKVENHTGFEITVCPQPDTAVPCTSLLTLLYAGTIPSNQCVTVPAHHMQVLSGSIDNNDAGYCGSIGSKRKALRDDLNRTQWYFFLGEEELTNQDSIQLTWKIGSKWAKLVIK